MDSDTVRAQARVSEADEAVTVNTRALIDKVLARYSSEWTVLRELVANAADASATKVTIRFTTKQPNIAIPPTGNSACSLEHTIRNSALRRLEVTNNGQVFGDSDWKRLKSIAEGNPDEQKIGAFGVGFYSVFADCENPLVLSGRQGLDFYWKGNALFTRKLELNEYRSDTSFVLDYRDDTTKLRDLVGLYRFLATSLTFVNLRTIELWLDSWKLLVLTKSAEDIVVAPVPTGIKATTKRGLMRITGIQQELMKMSATVISPTVGDLPGKGPGLVTVTNSQGQLGLRTSTVTVCLRMLSVDIFTSVKEQLALEIERATKKRPPKTTKLAILRSPSSQAFLNGEGDPLGIFDSVIPSKSGRIFIGFPTHQTTGLLFHMALKSVIPTVERESIDLNAKWVRDWNKEMLRVAGIAARIAWNDEMRDLKERIAQRNKPGVDRFPEALAEATHVFEQFAFKDSTPYSQVGQIIQETFWESGKPISVFSSQGVLPSDQVRVAMDGIAGFIDRIPILPEQITKVAEPFVTGLKANGFISEMSITDVKKELEAKKLENKQLLELLKWAQKKALTSLVEAKSVLASARALVRDAESGINVGDWCITLGSIRYYVNEDVIPSDLPVDLDTLPFSYTKIFSRTELHSFGWRELPLREWVRFLVSTSPFPTQCRRHLPRADIFRSPEFAANVLRIISKRWGYITTIEQQAIAALLKPKWIMPTKLGMMAPTRSYLKSVTLFQDLANVTGVDDVSETVLVTIGVQKMVELKLVLEKLERSRGVSGKSVQRTTAETWSFVDLINYLVTVDNQLTLTDRALLRNTSICHAEGNKSKLYKICDLYEPADTLRNLGLKTLDWPGTYRPGSNEDKFLRDLGLKQFPSVPDLVQIVTDAIKENRKELINRALEYFITSYAVNKYHTFDRAGIKVAYLPREGDDDRYCIPEHCFTSEGAALMNYPILRRDLQPHASKFGVDADPPMFWCLNRLRQHRPRSMKEAIAIFSYLAYRRPSSHINLAEQVGYLNFVPIFSSPLTDEVMATESSPKHQTILRYTAPRNCYIGDPKSFGKLFDFVDFNHEGNRFLRLCGAQWEPSCRDVAYRFAKQPEVLLKMLTGTSEDYSYWLQWLASRSHELQTDRVLWQLMKASAFLLGGKLESDQETRNNFPQNGVAESRETYSLRIAKEVVVVDDVATFKYFRSQLCTAPRNQILEDFYIELGSERLSKLVEFEHVRGAEVDEPLAAKKMENLVLERASFFLSDFEPTHIRVNPVQLREGLKVKTVSSITMRRTLKGYGTSKAESITAALLPQEGSSAGWTLWFTPKNYSMYDISAAISQVLLRRPTPSSQLTLQSLLGMDVGQLECYGFDVSRILVAQKEELRIAESQRRKDEDLRMKVQAEGLLPISTGISIGLGNSFASESSISQNLTTAIAASRAFSASSVFSATSSQQVKEAPGSTYCDVRPGKDLALAQPASTFAMNSLPIFLPRSLNTKTTWLREHGDSVNRFAAVLLRCAEALGVSKGCLHVFFEETGTTVAFNSDGSFFFNFRAWEEMAHGQKEGKDAERYWFVVFCHEVAHNLVKGHGPEHGYWTETLIIKNIAKLEASPPLPNPSYPLTEKASSSAASPGIASPGIAPPSITSPGIASPSTPRPPTPFPDNAESRRYGVVMDIDDKVMKGYSTGSGESPPKKVRK